MRLRREAFYRFDEDQRAASLPLRDCTDLLLLLEHLQALVFEKLVRESVVLQQPTVGSSMISCRTASASECTVATGQAELASGCSSSESYPRRCLYSVSGSS